MKIKLSLLLLVVLFTLQALAQEVTLRIAATSDLHGSLFPFDFEEGQPGRTSLEGVGYLVDSLRIIPGSNLVLLDNGDLVQGTPVAYYANFLQKRRKNLFARMLNSLKYDAATVGNHDIEAGPAVYNQLVKDFRFPYLAGNVTEVSTGRPYFKPYTVVEKGGIRIAVIGLITPAVPRWLPGHLWEGLAFGDMVEAARFWVNKVRDTEHPDVVVGLFHTGYGGDREDPADLAENAGREIAQNVPGFDVVILGHDHRPRNEIVTNSAGGEVLVLNPGSGARNLAVAEVVLPGDRGSVRTIASRNGHLIPVDENPSPGKFARHFRSDRKEILTFANREVGRLGNTMVSADALFGSSALTDLIHRVQLETTGADVSFAAPLSVSGSIDAGMLHVRDLFKMYRYENFLYTMKLTGAEIHRYLEYSYGLWFNRMQSDAEHLLLFRDNQAARPVLLNPSYNFDSAAGIRYTVDVSKPAGERVTITGMENGEPFNPAKTYLVALNSYRGSGGGGHLTTGAGLAPEILPERMVSASRGDFRAMLMEYIESNKVINPLPRDNWKVIPEEFAVKGRERDRLHFR
jgi:2',3'-cyclic-nucleotide 2'-phosphodiesterase/3'-nucleotidase